ncbi:MAG: hypothetical protein U0412_06125 [Nitrospira sp.]
MEGERTRGADRGDLEGEIVGLLRHERGLTMDEIAGRIAGNRSTEVFLTIDRWSREGVVRIRPGPAGYRVELTH